MADYQSYNGYGVDVAVNRADALDRECLAYIANHPGCRALDLGCGAGGQSVRMAEAGAQVVAVDQFDFSAQFATYDNPHLKFLPGDILKLGELLSDKVFAVALCQRTIHYLPYHAAIKSLRTMGSLVTDRLYISVTGSNSLVGEVYPAADLPLSERFAELSELGKEMFSINEPVCLYNETEFKQLLLDAGWQIDSYRVTAFGNIQAICNKSKS